jgi:hypothetical protein
VTFYDWMNSSEAMDLHMKAFDLLEELGVDMGWSYENMRCMAEQVLVGPI